MKPVEELLFKMADDELIIGHRHSELTGLGPILEEDIAMSSMAQDKIGHALALYTILHEEFGHPDPDTLAFRREEKKFKCCHLVELPNEEYDFTLARHFLFDHAELLRYELLQQSSFIPLAGLARKIHGELKYHVMHADSWFIRLGRATAESKGRMQSALNKAYPLALGVFEESPHEQALNTDKTFTGEKILRELWEERIRELVDKAHLELAEIKDASKSMGGRRGYHTDFLQPLLQEMSQVVNMEENAEW